MGNYFNNGGLFFTMLTLTISALASFTMFQLIGNLSRSDCRSRLPWMFGGAAVFGLGLAVVNFLVLLASDTMIIIDRRMLLLLLIGIGMTFLSLSIYLSSRSIIFRVVLSGLLLAGTNCGMFCYSVMIAPLDRFAMDKGLVFLALLLSWGTACCAFYWFERRSSKELLTSSLLLGTSVMIVQGLGLEAITVEYTEIMTADRLNENMMLLSAMMGVATLLVIGCSLMIGYANRRLGQADEKYKLLVENSLDTIGIFSEGEWRYVNQSGIRMFEASHQDELLNRSIFDLLHPKHHVEVKKRLEEERADGSFGPVEQEWYTMEGKLIHTEVLETPTMMSGKFALQIIIRDISERKKNEELLINSEKLYVAGQLAAGIAHEIRNPLTSLKGFLQLIMSGKNTNQNIQDIMKSELNRIESIVSEMLMLSKPQVYELNIKDTRQIMKDTVTLLEAQAILYDIELEAEYDEEALWIYGVENQIKQVFINVIKNAIEAMMDGGKIKIRCFLEGHEVKVQIRDQGPGINKEMLSKMGQPFYTTKDKGTGLGLMISYKIVDNHQGRIEANSEIGIGTTLIIALPYTEGGEIKV
ncbi:ATP-binding protein [Paenibacillus sp. GCM10012307]|uniref:histidine kinase n=1 Tax=Paenibacillus roseus TaxID=2798579 RepID=A0A934IW85_9BACL|nr:ATP-binding protein [Paenibacillus roseus]MBJ6360451.1 PAS domain S-box protein [Paenibacillus roseus]